MSAAHDALKANRGESIVRRPAIANGAMMPKPMATGAEYEGRRGLGTAFRLRIDRITADPDQPRKTFGGEDDDRLARSMNTKGQFVPILVRWDGGVGKYVIIDGERRYRAALTAKMADMAVVVEEGADPDEILETQLITNALRSDVKPVEQARAWDRLRQSQGLTYEQLGEKLGYEFSTISKRLDLLDLTPAIQDQVDAGVIPASTAGLLARLDTEDQTAVARQIVDEDLNRTEAKEAVRQRAEQKSGPRKPRKAKVATTRRFKSGGYTIEASHPRGIDVEALTVALRAFLADLEG